MKSVTIRFIKWQTSAVTKILDAYVNGSAVNALDNTSFLVTVVVLEKDGAKLEDVFWVQPKNNVQHFKLPELNAAIKDLYLSVQSVFTSKQNPEFIILNKQ